MTENNRMTIAAIATPQGISGLSVVRISGTDAIEIASRSFYGKSPLLEASSHTIHYGEFIDDGILIDTVTASVFREPKSYTGENIVEINCHGGYFSANCILQSLIKNGARLAEPGEFTKRAFLNGKLDLTQVEAVADLIHSLSVPASQSAARQLHGNLSQRIGELYQKLADTGALLELELDFAEEDIELAPKDEITAKLEEVRHFCNSIAESYRSAEILRSGYFTAIAGFPNTGKSTLFNSLLKRQRAIVSESPGTTRDYIEETIYPGGIPVRLIDTAGLRAGEDVVEIEGIRLARTILEQSNLILVINDISISENHSELLLETLKSSYPESDIILLQNKTDKIENPNYANTDSIIYISAKFGTGVDKLREVLMEKARKSTAAASDVLINARHADLLRKCTNNLDAAIDNLHSGQTGDIISIDIREAAHHLGEITGKTWSEEVLHKIFTRFCIGK